MKKITVKLTLIALMFTVSLFLLPVSSVIAADCSSAQIKMIGINPGAGGIGASDTKVSLLNNTTATVGIDWEPGTQRMFFLSADLGDAGLATLLTASSLGKSVWVRIADEAIVNSLITIIYLSE
ncbi:MAG: hypothetical protein OEM38_12525 [Gammaproteobacteria bacterium]|nr:hypothetical protein [Gammaproteobacteria bacterium]